MSNLFFAPKGKMNFLKKTFAGLMMLSLNLSVGGVGTIFLTTNVAYAARTTASATLNGTSAVSVQGGATISVSLTGALSDGDDWEGSGWKIDTTSPSSFSCVDTADATTTGSHTRIFSVVAPGTPGTYSAYFKIANADNCSGQNAYGSLLVLANAVTVLPPPKPDLTVTKTSVGTAVAGGSFKWKLHVENIGNATATFGDGKEILKDDMPSANVGTYGVATVENKTGITGSGTIVCTQTANAKDNLVCKVSNDDDDTVVIAAGGFFDVFVDVYPTVSGTLINPTNNGKCYVDKGYSSNSSNEVNESNENNNTCSNTVTVVNPPENTLDLCKDGRDNDNDTKIDLADENCAEFKPKLTVIKHVEGGGPSTAENFILHVNGGDPFGGSETGTLFVYTTTTSYSVTEDTAGDYVTSLGNSCTGTVAVGEHNTCTVTNYYDVCANIAGYQTSVPSGKHRDGNNCVDDVVETDLCSNIDGNQTEVPFGYLATDGQCVVACSTNLNLIQNGGFEAPIVDGWSIVPFTNATLKWLGAFVNPEYTANLGLEIQRLSPTYANNSGSQHAELDGYHPSVIYQDIPTIPGKEYALSFFHAMRGDSSQGEADNTMDVLVDDGVIMSVSSNSTTYANHTTSFVATGNTTKVAFKDTGTGSADNGYGNFLDDVVLSCVGNPQPTTGTLIIKKESLDGDGAFNFTVTGTEFSTTTSVTTEEGSGTAASISLTPDTDYTVDELSTEGWNFTSVSCEYDEESVGTSGATPTSHVINVEAGDTVTCTYTNTKIEVEIDPSCQVGGYKYDTQGNPVAGLVMGAMTKPFMITVQNNECDGGEDCDNEGTHQVVESRGKIVVTKTDETGHYCINGLRAESARVFEWPANGTEIDHMTDGEEPIQPRINSFFDIFTEVSISMSGHQPAQMDSFFDVFTDIDGVVSSEQISFFDIFTELNIAPAQQPTDSFFDVFTEVSLDGGRTVHFYNRSIPVTPAPPTGGGGSSTFDYPGCTNSAASNFNSLANKDDGSCKLPGGNGGGNNPPPAPSPAPQGEVLGAATGTPELALPPACAANPYLRDYLKMGKKNDPEQVKLLQTLLNEHMDAHLPITGHFGSLTKKWVKAFQKKNHAEIIKPWIDAGYKGKDIESGTGYVYKTTKRAINMIKCVGVIEALPDLTPDLGN